jgi:hypothetical protein
MKALTLRQESRISGAHAVAARTSLSVMEVTKAPVQYLMSTRPKKRKKFGSACAGKLLENHSAMAPISPCLLMLRVPYFPAQRFGRAI